MKKYTYLAFTKGDPIIYKTWMNLECIMLSKISQREKDTYCISSVQFSSFAQSCPTLCNPVNHSMPGLPVHHQLPEFFQTHVHRVSDAIQPSHPLSPPSPPAPNPSPHQSLFQWVNSYHLYVESVSLFFFFKPNWRQESGFQGPMWVEEIGRSW